MPERFPSVGTRRPFQSPIDRAIHVSDSGYRRLCEPPYITPTREGSDPYPAPHHYQDDPPQESEE